MQKPQDVSEPAIQDVSGDMDLLAALLTRSVIPNELIFSEDANLVWYGKTALENPLLDKPSAENGWYSPGSIDPKCEVKVLRKTTQSQNLEPFDRSKGQVVALVPGQALSCGIGPSLGFGDKQRITYLSAKDVLRWTKLSEWLHKYEQRYPRREVALSQSEGLRRGNALRWKFLPGRSEDRAPRDALLAHVPDFSVGHRLGWSYGYFVFELFFETMDFFIKNKVFLTLLVALPLVYGGIHLATWNFQFASQTEHLLWKIACVDTMGTIPLSVTFFACWSLSEVKMASSVQYIPWVLFTPVFIFYALSRIYIVVESFISLRHVPIGVYAAILWVQDIPHI